MKLPGAGLGAGGRGVAGAGEEVGDGVGEDVGVDELSTGGATDGGTLPPAGRSCCHDQPTDPPAGTVREPTPEDE